MKIIFFVLALLSISYLVQAQSELPDPEPYKRVYDTAGVLENWAGLNQILLEYENNTTIEMVIVTLDSLPPDRTIVEYGVDLVKKWGIGKKGKDNGILVLIVKDGKPGNRLRIELGYEIQGYITGAESGRILDEAFPSYESGNYSKAAEIIVAGLKEHLKNYEPGKASDDWVLGLVEFFANVGIFLFFILIFVVVGFFGRTKCPNCKSKKLTSDGDFYICKKCGKRFKKPKERRGGGFVYVGGGSGGLGGGGGGFGGGGSGGGGASRFYSF